MMDERFNPMNENDRPAETPATGATDSPVNETAAGVPDSPVNEPAAGAAGTQPQGSTPPMNGWSSDGSYRFVPPAGGQKPPQYQSPAYVQPNGQYWAQPTPPAKPPRKKHSGWIVAVAIVAAVGVIGSVVLLGLSALKVSTDTDKKEPTQSSSVQGDASGSGETSVPSLNITSWDDDDGGLSTREVINRNLDCTVSLTVYTQAKSFQFGESSLTQAGVASGIIMSSDGYVITNWHCAVNEDTGKMFDKIEVTTHDGQTYEAKVIGVDQTTDLAVIKVDATGLTAAKFGDSSELQMGDRVIALGNAAGLSWSATQGIVSALARDVYDDTGYAIKCLQIDAAINFGNSGGPLLNNQGLVVGINSAKIVKTGYENLAFSIPINEAKTIIDSLMKYGYVQGRVALGITGQTVSSGNYNGFMIASIAEGSSLQNTEAQVGDLIVAVDDATVTDFASLRSELAKHQVGDRVTLQLLRSDNRSGRVSSLSVTVTLKEQTAE